MGVRRWAIACVTLTAVLATGIGTAKEDEGIKADARKAGRAIGSAPREIWEGAKKAGKEIGHEAKKAGQAVGGAAKEGAQEFKRALKGEK